MKALDIRKLIGKTVTFKSNLTRNHRQSLGIGCVEDVTGAYSYISGDWHDNKTLEIIKVYEDFKKAK